MKKLSWFLLASVIVAIPLLLLVKRERQLNENIRYDINDYVTDEGL